MVKVICPECGAEFDTEEVDVVAHAISHWGVQPRDIGTLRNVQAQERYQVLLAQVEGGE